MRRVELLAPAGNMEALKAAVSNGCDAVYLGMQKFGALQLRLLRELEAGTIHRQEAQDEVERYWVGALRKAAVEGDVDGGSLMAGQAVGLMDKVTPISDMICELLTDANAELNAVKNKLVSK